MLPKLIAYIKDRICALIEMMFGPNWRTSLYGILAILPQLVDPIQQSLTDWGIEKKWQNLISLFFGVLTVLNASDAKAKANELAKKS